jgi:hypothetical protein
MKKAYVAPKVEKIAFDYSDVVVASKVTCNDMVVKTNVHHDGYTCEQDTVNTDHGVIGT